MSQINHKIGITPPIIENILHHLPMKDLNRCAKVCKIWYQTVQIIKRRRHQVSWMFWLSRSFGKSKKGPVGEIDTHISEILQNISSQPNLALFFASSCFLHSQTMFMYPTYDPKSKTLLIDRLMSQLPQNCLLLGTSCYGIVGTSTNCCSSFINKAGFTCLLLPEIPGVEVYPFNIIGLGDLSDRQILTDDELSKVTRIPKDKMVKSLILFCTEGCQEGEAARLVAKSLLIKQNHKMAIGGGFIDSFIDPKNVLKSNIYNRYVSDSIGIAFCGENVESASVTIKTADNCKEIIQKFFTQLKNCGLPEERSFAFMFSGITYYETNVTAEIFHKIFPKTPLFGFFGIGISNIALNCLLSSKTLPNEENEKVHVENLVCIDSAVFVLLSVTN